MKNILVTGGAGFIGSHLCRRLLAEGNRVYCLDNLYSGSRRNIEELIGTEGFTFIEGDVAEPYNFDVDQIYNLACPASPVHYQKDPVKTAKTCVLGAINALDCAERHHARVLQTSTSEIYGDPAVHPQTESYWGNVNPIGLRSCYDEGKRMSETLFLDYHLQYGTDIRIVRIFNTYGPRMVKNDGRVVSNFVVEALKNRPITVYGDGSQTRSFCYVDDTVEALIRMMNQDSFTGPVNIGNPDERTIREIADLVLELSGSGAGIIHEALPADDPVRRKPDISLAKEKLSWAPSTPLEEGLKRTIAWFRSVQE